jgi:hypothetical protein
MIINSDIGFKTVYNLLFGSVQFHGFFNTGLNETSSIPLHLPSGIFAIVDRPVQSGNPTN